MSDQELLNAAEQYGQVFAGSVASKKQLVEAFGTEGQKSNFRKNGKLTGKTGKAFKERLERVFEIVEDERVGRAIHYRLGNIRGELKPKKDGRTNSHRELAYTKYLDAMILMAFDSKLFNNHEATLNEWVWNFGLVNEALYSLKMNRINSESFKEVINEVNLKETAMELAEFQKDFNSKRDVLKRVLEKMDQENLIDFYKVPKAKLSKPLINPDDGRRIDIVNLNPEALDRANQKQRELREKYSITGYELKIENRRRLNQEAKRRVQRYESALQRFYEQEMYITNENGSEVKVEIDYIWYNYAISVKATKTKIKSYLKKHRPDFYDKYVTNEELFFSSSKDNFAAERRKVVLQKAYKRAEKMYSDILNEDRKMREDNRKFGKISAQEKRLREYWKNGFVDNVETLELHLKEDFKQAIK